MVVRMPMGRGTANSIITSDVIVPLHSLTWLGISGNVSRRAAIVSKSAWGVPPIDSYQAGWKKKGIRHEPPSFLNHTRVHVLDVRGT